MSMTHRLINRCARHQFTLPAGRAVLQEASWYYSCCTETLSDISSEWKINPGKPALFRFSTQSACTWPESKLPRSRRRGACSTRTAAAAALETASADGGTCRCIQCHHLASPNATGLTDVKKHPLQSHQMRYLQVALPASPGCGWARW